MENYIYSGGAWDPATGLIFFAPHSQTKAFWHYFDPKTKTIGTYTAPNTSVANTAYSGAVYHPIKNQIIFIPYSQGNRSEFHAIQLPYNTHIKPEIHAHYLFNQF